VSRSRNKEDDVPEPGGTDRIVDVRDLGELLRKRRSAAKLTLRDVEAQLDHALTASSLSRLENGATADSNHVPVLARWLGIPLELVAWPGHASVPTPGVDTPTVIEVHLRADKNLPPGAGEALAKMFRRLYQDFASGDLPVANSPKSGSR